MATKPESLIRRDDMLYICFVDYTENHDLSEILDRLFVEGDIENYWSCYHPAYETDLPFGHPMHVHCLIMVGQYAPLSFLEGLGRYWPRLCNPDNWYSYTALGDGEALFGGEALYVYERQECY